MQMTISGEMSSTRLDASLVTLLLAASNSAPQQQTATTPPPVDHLELSEQARKLHHHKPSAENRIERAHERMPERFHDFLKNLLTRLTNSSVTNLEPTSSSQSTPAVDQTQVPQPSQEQTLFAQQTNSFSESFKLSLNGTIDTADGEHLSFSLDLEVMHSQVNSQALSFQSNSDGLALSYAGTAAELTSTSFNFDLSSSGGSNDTTGEGVGTFSLKDELKEIRQAIKPLVKELFKAADLPDGWSSINRLLHVIA